MQHFLSPHAKPIKIKVTKCKTHNNVPVCIYRLVTFRKTFASYASWICLQSKDINILMVSQTEIPKKRSSLK